MRHATLALLAGLTVLEPPPLSQQVFRAGTTLVEVSAVITRAGRRSPTCVPTR